MIYEIRHITRYAYSAPVSQCHNLLHLMPRNTKHQRCISSRVDIKPTPVSTNKREDYFGNKAHYFSLQAPHKSLEITVHSKVDVKEEWTNLNLEFGATCAQVAAQLKKSTLPDVLEAREFLLDSPMIAESAELQQYARASFAEDKPFLSAVRDLTKRIFDDYTYAPESTTVATPLAEVMKHRRGVCQDFAHLAIGCLRTQGFAARYVSGYLETIPPVGQKKLVGADASHAWLSVFVPGEGWYDFDPTNNQIAKEQHITTAWGRDYSDVTPLKGVIFGGGKTQTLEVSVDVSRV